MNYWNIIGLEKEPFSTSPDPDFFYRSMNHRTALANLLIEIRLKRGLSVVLGEIGTGKTTLGRKLIQILSESQEFLFHIILNPVFRTEELFFDALVKRFGIRMPVANPTMGDYWEHLEQFLYKRGIETGQTIVLIIDEAHKLDKNTLEALRVLLNYETNNIKLLQVVLLGQMELLPTLQDMPNLNQRISLKYILQPLQLDEVKHMIEFRLGEAGYSLPEPLFSTDAIQEIYHYTHGSPREIASVCHRALRLIVMKNQTVVNKTVIKEIIQQDLDIGWTQTKILQKSAS